MKKVVISLVLVAGLGGAAAAMGGMSWFDSMGLRGQKRLVESRIEGYWEARMDGDVAKIAAFTHPLQESVPDPGILVTEAYEIHDLQVEGETAVAKLTVKSRLKHPIFSSRERTTELQSRWVRYEGKWYKDLAPTTLTDAIRNVQGTWTPPTADSDESASVDQ